MFTSRKSFTLIELLVVLAIVAILSVVVIMTLNPAELLKQARDSNRLSDLGVLNTALATYSADIDGGFMGTSTVIYVSLPDSTTTCANLGLPTAPTGYSYYCSSSANYKKVDGTGWIPVNFTQTTFGAPISNLPVDPVNATTTGNYYKYLTGGSFELAASMEALKNKGLTSIAGTDGGRSWNSYELGPNLSLIPLQLLDGESSDSSLAGWYLLNEGSGTSAIDYSGNNRNGSFLGSPKPQWTSGRNDLPSLTFDGLSSYISIPQSLVLGASQSHTFTAWVNANVIGTSLVVGIVAGTSRLTTYSSGWMMQMVSGQAWAQTSQSAQTGQWVFLAGIWDGQVIRIYVNGSLATSANYSAFAGSSGLSIGKSDRYFNGMISEVRVYNRALSAGEVAALYNATR